MPSAPRLAFRVDRAAIMRSCQNTRARPSRRAPRPRGRGSTPFPREVLYIHHLGYRGLGKRGLTGLYCVYISELMSDGNDIRVGLLRRRVTHEEFAESCGMGVRELKGMLDGGEVSDGVRGAYAALEAGGEMRDGDIVEVDTRRCVFGRAVKNDTIQVIDYLGGGKAGMLRKRRDFKPRHGLPCEVRASGEDGWLELVGNYRDNGVRLD